MRLIQVWLAVVFTSLLLQGCRVYRKLEITEIQPNQVEIFLNEPSGNALDLTNMKLKWISHDPAETDPNKQMISGELNLGIAGTLHGGQFLVIFEDRQYTDPPVAAAFHSPIPGIKVRNGFFPGYANIPSVSMSLEGEHQRGFVTDIVTDVVRFGPRPRPNLSGTFNEDGSLDQIHPTGSRSVSRTFSGNTPQETDSESDWSLKDETPGLPTGP